MNYLIKTTLIVFMAFALANCSSANRSKENKSKAVSENIASGEAENNETALVIYGSHGCSHCVNFKAKLDSANMNYIFNDIDQNDQHVLALQDILRRHNYFERVQLPVVYINNETLLIGPEFAKVYDIINSL